MNKSFCLTYCLQLITNYNESVKTLKNSLMTSNGQQPNNIETSAVFNIWRQKWIFNSRFTALRQMTIASGSEDIYRLPNPFTFSRFLRAINISWHLWPISVKSTPCALTMETCWPRAPAKKRFYQSSLFFGDPPSFTNFFPESFFSCINLVCVDEIARSIPATNCMKFGHGPTEELSINQSAQFWQVLKF